MNLFEVSKEISDRLTRIFLRDEVVGGPSMAYGEVPERSLLADNIYFLSTSMATMAPD